MSETKHPKHVGKYREEAGLIDMWECSCGWESKPYYDGAHWAEEEWRKHVRDARNPRKVVRLTLPTPSPQ